MKFKDRILFFIIYWAVTLYARTWRYETVNRQAYDRLIKEGKKVVMAIWHDQLLPCAFFHRNEGMVTVASDSKDGELITYALNRWGFRTARGSSTRGGAKAALKAVKLSAANNAPCAVTVDGPKGPRHKVKPGAVFIAKKLDGAILIGLISCRRYKRFASWDRFVLPMPFSRITITYSEPVFVSGNTDEKEMEKDTENLQKLMTELTGEASPFFV